MTQMKPRVGEKVDTMSFLLAGAEGEITIGQAKDRWTMLFVYRGKHCRAARSFWAS